MNHNLTNAVERAARIGSLLTAVEMFAAQIEIDESSIEVADTAENLLYLTEEVIKDLRNDLDLLEKDALIVDVYDAVRKARIEERNGNC